MDLFEQERISVLDKPIVVKSVNPKCSRPHLPRIDVELIAAPVNLIKQRED